MDNCYIKVEPLQIYCVRNDIDNVYFYLIRAAKKENKEAKDTLKELKEKNVLSIHMKKSKEDLWNYG